MTSILYKASSRGHAEHGWLNSYHTFSFANYYNPTRVHFGALRVLNDDTVAAGMGFGGHPHDNMEIISIPLEGDLQHKDSMGTTAIIKHGDVQIMSAGTGIQHSEMNANKDKEVKFLQIWIIPKIENVTPRYGQITLNEADRRNKLQVIVSPDKKDGDTWINQDAWFSMGNFDKGVGASYSLHKPNNGLFAFVLEGDFTIAGEKLNRRDGLALSEIEGKIEIEANSDNAQVLLMEVPMM